MLYITVQFLNSSHRKTPMKLGFAAAALLAFLLDAAALYAQSTAIYACVNSASGEVKIVTAGTECVGNRTLVQWGIAGPTGATGPQGPKGDSPRTDPMTFAVHCE